MIIKSYAFNMAVWQEQLADVDLLKFGEKKK
jgi:hypothetical protein